MLMHDLEIIFYFYFFEAQQQTQPDMFTPPSQLIGRGLGRGSPAHRWV